MLKNTFSQRKVASSNEVKRKIKNLAEITNVVEKTGETSNDADTV